MHVFPQCADLLNDVYGDIVIDKTEDIKIQVVDVAFNFQDIFFAHFVAFCIFDDSNTAVKLVQFQIVIDGQAHACLDMV